MKICIVSGSHDRAEPLAEAVKQAQAAGAQKPGQDKPALQARLPGGSQNNRLWPLSKPGAKPYRGGEDDKHLPCPVVKNRRQTLELYTARRLA